MTWLIELEDILCTVLFSNRLLLEDCDFQRGSEKETKERYLYLSPQLHITSLVLSPP